MPHLFRLQDGELIKPGRPFPLTRPDASPVEGLWAGSATHEKIKWWLGKPGHELVQSAQVSEIGIKAEDDNELIWGDAPPGAHLMFVLLPAAPGKSYRLAKMVTTACTPAQTAYFRDKRCSLFGVLRSDGSIDVIPPLEPPSSSSTPRQH